MTDQEHNYEPLIEQYVSTSAQFFSDIETEAETYYYLRSATEAVRPSVIFGLARVSKDLRQFCDLIQKAVLAGNAINHAESIAAEACEGFSRDKAHSADLAWLLILLAAGDKALPDPEWVEARAMCKRVHERMNKESGTLVERLLGDAGTQPVCLDGLPDWRVWE